MCTSVKSNPDLLVIVVTKRLGRRGCIQGFSKCRRASVKSRLSNTACGQQKIAPAKMAETGETKILWVSLNKSLNRDHA